MFIVEQRPWLGIWLTICFSGIRGEATEKEWGNDVLTMQPMDWQICKYANLQMDWLVGLDDYGDHWDARRHSLGIKEETHARTFSTLKKTHSFFPILFAQPRGIKTRVFAFICVMSLET